VIRHVVSDSEGHVIASRGVDRRHRSESDMHAAPVVDWDPSAAAVAGSDGVSTERFQELYSRASHHLVRVTGSHVDALGDRASPFGNHSSTIPH